LGRGRVPGSRILWWKESGTTSGIPYIFEEFQQMLDDFVLEVDLIGPGGERVLLDPVQLEKGL